MSLRKTKKKGTKNNIFNNKDYSNGDGMITAIWGPNMWHYIRMMSISYPITLSQENRTYNKQYS